MNKAYIYYLKTLPFKCFVSHIKLMPTVLAKSFVARVHKIDNSQLPNSLLTNKGQQWLQLTKGLKFI